MREIKFRAWNTDLNRMVYGDGIFSYTGIIHVLSSPPQPNGTYKSVLSHMFNGHIMQYTGLKDSKRTKEYPEGQEIYEGDIVRFLNDLRYIVSNEKEYLVGEVKFIDGAFWCFYEDEENLTRLVSVMVDYWAGELKGNQCEIIGNIKENPELIGEKQ